MFLTFGGLIGLSFVCLACLSINLLIVALTGEIATLPPNGTLVTPPPPEQVNELLVAIDSLVNEVELLEASVPVVPPAAAPLLLGKAAVLATHSDVNLYSCPRFDCEVVSPYPVDQRLEIVGRNSDATWWLVEIPGGSFAWTSAALVTTFNASEAIPVVAEPSALAQQAAITSSAATLAPTLEPTPMVVSTPPLPPGTPTPAATLEYRLYVDDSIGYQALARQLMVPPVSKSFSPDGNQIVVTERIKVYTVAADGGSGHIWLEENDKMGPIGGAVWSPDGRYIAFVVGFKHKYCRPCRAVALLNPTIETITFLGPPETHLDTDMPRWLQDGRLMINAHPGEPADGVAYVYDISGKFQPATGVYVLSASHEGQKWFPWQPGRTWRAGVSERADSYNSD
jgi:hypothetical protein